MKGRINLLTNLETWWLC